MIAVIILLGFLLGVHSSCGTFLSPNNLTCPASCTSCDNSTLCQSCCSSFYLNTPDLSCRACSTNCLNCTYDSSYNSKCVQCIWGYGQLYSNYSLCVSCTTSNAVQCSSINGCSSGNTCAYCPYFALLGGACRSCPTLYRNCQVCSDTSCWGCSSGYYLNASASSNFHIMQI